MRTLAVGMLCLALVLLAVSPAVLAGEGEQYTYTFRSTWWGMSQDEVRQAENSSFIREETKQRQLIYECTIDGYECNIFYGFDNRKKLISGAYAIDSQKVKHANLNDYLDDYDYFRDLLVAKYGRPWMEGPKWNELVYRDYAGTYGLAVSTGKLYYLANWATTCSDITLNLQGSDGRIVLTIVYTTTGTMPPLLEPGQTQEAANL